MTPGGNSEPQERRRSPPGLEAQPDLALVCCSDLTSEDVVHNKSPPSLVTVLFLFFIPILPNPLIDSEIDLEGRDQYFTS